jgi:hypothetical protein
VPKLHRALPLLLLASCSDSDPATIDADSDGDGYEQGSDCNDSDPTIHPGATEICGDGIDQNCDGVDLQCNCTDADGDGAPAKSCGGPDCDDKDAAIHPGATEICGDGVDNDCSGADLACLACADGAVPKTGCLCGGAEVTSGFCCANESQAASCTAVSRPDYNTGTGFFVLDGKLYDANGTEFRIRGVNKAHYDWAWPGIPKTRANTIRWSTPLWLGADLISSLMKDTIDAKIVPMPAVWFTDGSYTDATNVTCKNDPGILATAVSQWVAHAATFKPFERNLLVNIANEWGPENSTVWRDAYVSAVAELRTAGYLGTIVIDSGGCGQDPRDIVNFAADVFESDPQKNIVFDVHIYGAWANGDANSWQHDLTTWLDNLAATKLPIIVGEFGPGRDIGPSPTKITPGQIMEACDARGFGWLAWAWDDGNNDDWFAMSYNGDYNSSADLTLFGKDVVETPAYGLLFHAQPATTIP